MTTRTDLDRMLDRWFEEDRVAVADHVIDDALVTIDKIPQRSAGSGGPWRFATMSSPMRLVAVVAIVAGIGLGGIVLLRPGNVSGLGGASPSAPALASQPSPASASSAAEAPAPTPIDTATWRPFISMRGGYSAGFPTDWATTPASAPWTLATIATDDEARFDHFAPKDGLLIQGSLWRSVDITAASMAMPAGMTEEQWLDTYRPPSIDRSPAGPSGCVKPWSEWTAVSIDGHPGWLDVACQFAEATTFFNGRAYVFTLYVGGIDQSMEDLFTAFLGTVHLDPGSAVDAPAASAPASPSATP
jgi:hypothetical protein